MIIVTDRRSVSGSKTQPYFQRSNEAPKPEPENLPVSFAIFGGVLIAVLLGLLIYAQLVINDLRAPKAQAATSGGWVVSNGGVTTISHDFTSVPPQYAGDNASAEIIQGPLLDAAREATREWELALGIRLKVPRLFKRDPQHSPCAFGSAACALTGADDSVTVVDVFAGQEKTVLMHEIGHLLGVPHIEKDALMNQVYQDAVDKPTEQAIALAKLQHIWDKKDFKLRRSK